jgi:hypothetical protein
MNTMIAITINPGATTAELRLIVLGNPAPIISAGGDHDQRQRPRARRTDLMRSEAAVTDCRRGHRPALMLCRI